MSLKMITSAVFVLLFALMIFFLRDYWWRCSSEGLSREAAQNIANEKLAIQVKGYSANGFTLKSAQKKGSDWLFSYGSNGCIVDIVINRCGVADVGGLASECS